MTKFQIFWLCTYNYFLLYLHQSKLTLIQIVWNFTSLRIMNSIIQIYALDTKEWFKHIYICNSTTIGMGPRVAQNALYSQQSLAECLKFDAISRMLRTTAVALMLQPPSLEEDWTFTEAQKEEDRKGTRTKTKSSNFSKNSVQKYEHCAFHMDTSTDNIPFKQAQIWKTRCCRRHNRYMQFAFSSKASSSNAGSWRILYTL